MSNKISQIKDENENTYYIEPAPHTSEKESYGLSTEDRYGHCRLINNLNCNTYYEGEGLDVYQGSLLAKKIKAIGGRTGTSTIEYYYKFSNTELGVSDASNVILLGILVRDSSNNIFSSDIKYIYWVNDGIAVYIDGTKSTEGDIAIEALFYIINE